jgi:aminopeptidase N
VSTRRRNPYARWCLRAALIASAAGLLTQAAITRRPSEARGYDVVRYALDLTLLPESSIVTGAVTVTLTANEPLAALRLDADSGTIRIDSVLSGGRPLPFARTGDVLVVPLPGGAKASETVELTVHYLARSAFDGSYDDGGILFTRTGTGTTVGTISQPNFARRWWPCNDRPADKALVTLRCSVPPGMTVVSNGRQLSKERLEGRDVFTWATGHPVATYLVFLGAADYAVSRATHTLPDGRSVELAWYAFPEDSAKAAADFANTRAILDYFSETFAPYPFADEQFAVAEVDGRLTMENQTVVAIERALVTGDRSNENTFVHETAHQWWGDLVTPADWTQTWLNEGFATYAEALYIESRKGPEAYRQYIDRLMDQPAGSYAGSVIGRDENAFWDSFGPAVYYKGALTLHMLRRMMGDGPFFDAMRAYLRDPRLAYGNASTEDFRAACEASHRADLGWFFRQWVYAARDSADRPSIACRWSRDSSAQGGVLRVVVSQTGSPEPAWRLPFTIRVRGGGSSEDFAVVDSLPVQEFLLPSTTPADSVLIDPERDLFMTVRKEPMQ